MCASTLLIYFTSSLKSREVLTLELNTFWLLKLYLTTGRKPPRTIK